MDCSRIHIYPLRIFKTIVETKRWNNERHSYSFFSCECNGHNVSELSGFRQTTEYTLFEKKPDNILKSPAISLKIFFTVICNYLRSECHISPKDTKTSGDKR